MKSWMIELINDVRLWCDVNHITHAVVGFSGGIDSATTAALLNAAKISTVLVSVNVEDQTYSSNYDPCDFVDCYDYMSYVEMDIEMPAFRFDAGKEAALPILRNACFYGVAADYRARFSSCNPVVVGTANFDESAYLGFWGKASDGAQDMYPISHLHKSEVYQLAKALKVPKEIIKAVPSGDLQWSGDLNDYKMIGATYDQIEAVGKAAIRVDCRGNVDTLREIILAVDDPKKFIDNINRNQHKYKRSFPGAHLDRKLETFRKYYYSWIIKAISDI